MNGKSKYMEWGGRENERRLKGIEKREKQSVKLKHIKTLEYRKEHFFGKEWKYFFSCIKKVKLGGTKNHLIKSQDNFYCYKVDGREDF